MTDPVGPRPDVLAERIAGLAGNVKVMQTQMSQLATKQELLQFMSSRDELMTSQINDLREDIKDLTKALENERTERMTGDREIKDQAGKARMFALSAIGLVVTVVLGLIALINQIGGAPT